jgi:hypothetical protein
MALAIHVGHGGERRFVQNLEPEFVGMGSRIFTMKNIILMDLKEMLLEGEI